MEFTLDEALLRLKAEVLAPDWRLNERRAAGLLQALAVVAAGCRGRRPLLGICGMSRAALDYHRARGEGAPPAVLDFGKQALAHLVALLEEEDSGATMEEETFARLHDRFQRLKERLRAGSGN